MDVKVGSWIAEKTLVERTSWLTSNSDVLVMFEAHKSKRKTIIQKRNTAARKRKLMNVETALFCNLESFQWVETHCTSSNSYSARDKRGENECVRAKLLRHVSLCTSAIEQRLGQCAARAVTAAAARQAGWSGIVTHASYVSAHSKRWRNVGPTLRKTRFHMYMYINDLALYAYTSLGLYVHVHRPPYMHS